MLIKTIRVLDIRKASKRASLFSTISGICGCIAMAIMFITVSTMDFEPVVGHRLHSDLYYGVTLLGSLILAGIAYGADRVATHIRELIANSIHEDNEVKWGRSRG